MKHPHATAFLLAIALAFSASAQNIDDLPSLAGSAVDKANDKILVRDASVTASAGALRSMTIGDLVNVPTLFSSLEPALGNPGTNGYVLSSTTSGTRSWIAPGGTWGSITGTLSSQSDLTSALAAKAASGANTDITSLKGGVVVLKSTGLVNFYPPSADTDTARFTAFTTANATLTSGDSLMTLPGAFQITSAVTLVANVRYEFGKSRFYLSAGVSSVYYFTISAADDVTISGGYFDGASVNVGYGCFNIASTSRRTRILNARFANWPQGNADTATIVLQAGGTVTHKHQSALVDGCYFEGNYRSIAGIQEFVTVSNCSFSGDGRSIELYAGGNWIIANSNLCASTVYPIRVRDGANDSHTIISGCKIAHNSGKSLQVDVAATNGVILSNCQIYADTSTSGYIDISGSGVSILGGILDAPLSNTSTVAGRGRIADVFIPGSNAAMGWTGANRMMFNISGCYTPTGQWSHNDLQTYTYADNTAAAAAGLEAGRQYKDSSGNLKIVY